MESTAALTSLRPNYLLCSSRRFSPFLHSSSSSTSSFNHSSPLFLKKKLRLPSINAPQTASPISKDVGAIPEFDWDNLGFGIIPTDYMYVMKCSQGDNFSNGELKRFGNIELSPSAGVLNYGQGLFEGLKAYRKEDDSILLFRPEENALRMKMGAERMCMQSPTVDQFVEAVKTTVLANKRWVPPSGKGSLYIRPLLMGSGAVLGLAPAPEYTFVIYVSPVGNYFKEGLAPINLVVEHELHRATPGGTGSVKTIGNYAAVLKAQSAAKAKGYSDVLYLDCVHKKYLEEVSSCNIFVVKGNVISTPAIKGTILPGITRKSIIDVARSLGFQVEERLVAVDELLEADEVFCTGTAVVISPVGSVTYLGKRIAYGNGVGVVSQQLYSVLTRLQMGLIEDKMNWTVSLS
uniref:Branched-chain-amino-acid aminotransferase n=1 Tax=Cucumis sativus TaxID=3659 RepID=A0A0S2GLQ9_CUCSA|nr:branched-chain amino acid aminotransferase [Cucumis sativus]ALN97500.1 branched-chain amino acid aminotransferase [Cucumis sativus]ALN97504.1 branched-chain amino acid aminotransferase [Cucumis sativus]ALN97508.1 branched-chain amino acid aminotransferase [Cucumis sativus]ALN97516.1 branched-chain amino acid aminotransferase [Cucumis sativus]